MQVGSGAAGALIVEYDQNYEGLPNWLADMEEIVLVVQYLELRFMENIYEDGIDNVYVFSRGSQGETSFWTVG